MTYLDLLLDMAQRPHERFLSVLDGLTVEQANAFATSAIAPTIKSITWLAWHTAREIDAQLAHLAGTPSLWDGAGWREKFALELPDETDGFQHTPEQAAKIVVQDINLLRDYLTAATEALLAYLRSLDTAALDEIIDHSWNPPVTRGVRLVSMIDDASMHSGQAIYARRLLGLAD